MSKMRILKVYAKYRRHERNRPIFDPVIRMQGRWLEAAGIKPGDRIRVQTSAGNILITLETEPCPGS